MSAAGARLVVSTAFAAVALVLVSAAPAAADPPQCTAPPPQTVVEGLQLILSVSQFCSDPDGDPLIGTVGPATHGMTGAMGSAFGYSPDPGYTGPDAFTLTASDGMANSDPVTVNIVVAPNQPPSCPATRNIHVIPDTQASFDPREGCVDDAGGLQTEIVMEPDHGTMSPPGPFGFYTYTPDTGYQGSDTFTIALKDHLGASDQVIVAVTIAPNHAPVCVTPVTRQVAVGGTLVLDPRNTCSDPDGDAISGEAIEFPAHGQLVPGIPPTVNFIAEPGYSGADRIVYRVRDVFGEPSNDAVLDLVIGDPPVQQQTQTQTQATTSDLTAPSLKLTHSGPQRLAAARRNGLKLRLASDEAGTATIELWVAKRVSRRLGIPRGIGRVTKTLVPGDNEVVVRLTRRAKRRLASVKRATIFVVVTGRDNAGNATSATLEVVLRR